MSTSRIDLILRQLDALPPLPAEARHALEPKPGEPIDVQRLRPLVDALALAADPVELTGDGTVPDPRLELWMHGLAVGCAAELLAGRITARGGGLQIDPAEAFCCGLLHDVGKLALHAALPKGYARVIAAADVIRGNILDIEKSVIGLDHHTAGKRLAERWRLSPRVRDVIWLHNQHPDALPETAHARMILLVTLADALVRGRRIGYSGNHSFGPPIELVMARLGVVEDDAQQVARDVVGLASQRSEGLGLSGADPAELYRRALERSAAELAETHARLSSHEQAGSARRRCFAAMAGLGNALHPSATLADVLAAIAQAAAEALDCGPVAGFAFAGETAAEMVLIESGRPVQRGHADERAETACMRPVRPAANQGGDGPVRVVEDDLEWVTSIYGPHLRGHLRWWLRLESDERAIGGIVWGGGADELERLGPVLSELSGLCGGWSLALRAIQSREESAKLAEQLAQANQRFADIQEQLAQERAALSLAELAAGAAHEMNNPLMIISGRSQLLSRRLSDPRDRHAAEVIHQNAGRVSDMITELMRFARPDPADRRPTAVESLFTETIRLITDVPERAERQIEWSLPELPPVHVDGKQVARAIAALVENGLQATLEKIGRIEVHAAPDVTGTKVMITVLDNGSGMSPVTLRRAFDPFFSKKKAGRRRGMGLPVALRLIECNGGTLRLDSREGTGTRALIMLPLAEATSQAGQRLSA